MESLHLKTEQKISLLWIVVMFNMAFADILTFMIPGTLKQIVDGTTEVTITQEFMLIMAFLVEIPILMIYLSNVLGIKANKIVNIIASIITIVFVIAGGMTTLHYYFLAGVEVISMLLIIRLAWQLKGK